MHQQYIIDFDYLGHSLIGTKFLTNVEQNRKIPLNLLLIIGAAALMEQIIQN